MSVFFFGLGYSARAILAAIRAARPETRFSGTTRTPDRVSGITALGATAHVFDGRTRDAGLAADLAGADWLISSAAPGADGDPVLAVHRDDILAAPRLSFMCYLSTIGVYGDAGGAWIDESFFGENHSARARARLAAEVAWQRLARSKDVPLLILRLAGIYGPGRSAFDKLRAGTAQRIVKPGQVFNRIHADDIGRVVALAGERRLSGIFNLTDDLPTPPQDVTAHAAGLLSMTPPPEIAFEDAQLSPMAREFYADNKRVSNQAIKIALGIEMLHPTYREGLSAILAAQSAPAD